MSQNIGTLYQDGSVRPNPQFTNNVVKCSECERLRAALSFYADEKNYGSQLISRSCGCCSDFDEPKVVIDKGQTAREALNDR